MALGTGERQEATTLAGIRPDHRSRYSWAADRLKEGDLVVDAACGVGYGSRILGERGLRVRAYDRDPEAIAYANAHYNSLPSVKYSTGDVYDVAFPQNADAVVAFEIIEHLTRPEEALLRWHEMAPRLMLSVPNEAAFPYRGNIAHHVRHYTRDQLSDLLTRNGWRPTSWWGQRDDMSPPEPNVTMGRTLVVEAERVDGPFALAPRPSDEDVLESLKLPGRELPKSIAIVAMGASMQYYWRDAAREGGIDKIADEVWMVNMLAGVGKHHRLFHQDDLKIQEARAALALERNDHERAMSFQGMLDSVRDSEVPVYTSRAYDDYPNAVEYPLEWVINRLETYYINSTVAAALCMALAMKPERIKLYGCDFAYPHGDRHKGERGRACVEFWLGWASANHIMIELPPYTNLLDRDVSREERFYGYDTEWVKVDLAPNGILEVARTPRAPEDIPSAKEIERRYSHDSRAEKAPI